MRTDYEEAIIEAQRIVPPEYLALLLGMILGNEQLSPGDQDVIAKIHELAAVNRARPSRLGQPGLASPTFRA